MLFQFIMPLPTKSTFLYRDSEDIISLFTHHRKIQSEEGVKIQIITGISDSKMKGPDFMSEMAMRIVIRDIENGFKKKYQLDNILERITVLKHWKKSNTYSVQGEETPSDLLNWNNMSMRD